MRLVFIHIFLLCLAWSFSQEANELLSVDTIQGANLNTDTLLSSKADSTQLSKSDSVIALALNYRGIGYRYGGIDVNGFDCSGLVCVAYKHVNVRLPHSSSALAGVGEAVEADYLEKGDLIFFKGHSSNKVGHVAIVSKIVDGLVYIVHATSSRGVIEEVLQENSYFMSRWLFNRRVH